MDSLESSLKEPFLSPYNDDDDDERCDVHEGISDRLTSTTASPSSSSHPTSSDGGLCHNNDLDCLISSTHGTPLKHFATKGDIVVDPGSRAPFDKKHSNWKLLAIFILFILSGTGNAVFQKLQAVPMYNYPNFLNVFTCMLYIPLCFAYIIPAAYLQIIPPAQLKMSKAPFAIMGLLDCTAGLMQTFASVYLPGPLMVLLPQAAIAISMVLSRYLLSVNYHFWQYLGAGVVIVGIVTVLIPFMTNHHASMYTCSAVNIQENCVMCRLENTEQGCRSHAKYNSSLAEIGQVENFNERLIGLPFVGAPFQDDNDFLCKWELSNHDNTGARTTLIWSALMVLSCVPMALSSIYKERTMGNVEIDTIYLNGWVAIFQTIYSTILIFPAGLVSSPIIRPSELPYNMWEGLQCYRGHNSFVGGCHPDECHLSPLFVNTFLFVNYAYSNFMVLLLKVGSANMMFLALTVIVPLGNLAFALPIMPDRATLRVTDMIGLAIIMAGIVSYRFGSKFCSCFRTRKRQLHAGDCNDEEIIKLDQCGSTDAVRHETGDVEVADTI